MVLLASGDRDAFATVFDGLWPSVRAFAVRATGDAPEAEDIAQRTLLKVFSRITDFDTTRDGVAWVFGIAAFEIKTFRKQRQRRKEGPEIDSAHAAAPAATPEEAAIEMELRQALTDVLGELKPTDREVLLSDRARNEPASATSRKRRQRALGRLRDLWRRRYE